MRKKWKPGKPKSAYLAPQKAINYFITIYITLFIVATGQKNLFAGPYLKTFCFIVFLIINKIHYIPFSFCKQNSFFH